ncbi:T-cell-specific guanine nucleotide triphosphate-binding protein 2-like [Ruditapes philippinarum]|uniref:T-cell-specific guanine nucleotide triphosphate-binding protein 2-like n=1 Tax=Ruditapes philippinarum TaxID=129788 RepID=UPI00295B9AC0|nr:T-cell-specific guanine nucleotide triphosphate-binding protein 2-like [Ruditapes philippinarum]
MWWINVFVFLILMAVLFRAIEWLLQEIPSEIETKNKADLPVKQSKEPDATKQGTLIKRKRVMAPEHSGINEPVISETSELTDEQSYRELTLITKAECCQISSDYISEETEICKDEKGVLESVQYERTCHDESNSCIDNLEFDKFRSFVDGNQLKKEMETSGVLNGLNKYIANSFDTWNQRELNVAVSGYSGVGKSSLINALRHLKPTDEGAAAVDVVETTKNGCKYTYPKNPNVAIWDLPGLGTQTFKKDKYLKEMNIARFDVVLIVSAGRFFENDIWLGKELRSLRKNIIFVRTKIDIDLMNAKRDHPRSFNEGKCLAKIKKNLSDSIREGGLPALVSGVFLVSSAESEKYDFNDLDKKLKDMLSTKGKAIRCFLQNYVEIEINKNKEINKNGFRFEKAVSILFGFVPTQALTETLCQKSLSNINTTCQQRFCIDENSLDKTSKELINSEKGLKGKLKSFKKIFTPDRSFNSFQITKFSIPVLGMFLSAHNSYVKTKKNIDTMCDEMAEDVLKLVNCRLEKLEKELQPKLSSE